MNKKLFLIPAFAMGIAMASCSNEDPANNSGGNGNFETNYLSINLVQAPDMASRAGGNQTNGQPGGDSGATYEEGYASENAVTNVRFYFFYENGDAAPINTNGVNYYNYTPSVGGSDMPNVEKQLEAIVVINTKNVSGLPDKMVAILNPEKLSLGDGNLTLAQIQAKEQAKDFATSANASSPVFVMSNSVYSDGAAPNPNKIVATSISTDNYANSENAAKANPINIYVERAVAKVRVTLGLNNEANNSAYDSSKGLIALKDKEGQDITINGQQVYLKLDNWNVTADTDKGNLFKDINAGWGSSDLGSLLWNYAPYFRSYWAKNVDGATQNWHPYNDIATGGKKFAKSSTAQDDSEIRIYVNENAPQLSLNGNEENFTKVIMAGTLGILEGDTFKAVPIAKYASVMMTGEEALIDAMLGSLGSNMIYYQDASSSTIKSLAKEDVKLMTALKAQKDGVTESEKTTGRYNVYLQLKENLHRTWSKSNTPEGFDGAKFANDKAVNDHLISSLGRGQLYSGGQTYYYFPIKHLGEVGKIGEYGVVRNHIYDCKITTLVGLGTPVYDPTETIWPEKPVDDETYIAAQINILSWRLVSQDVNLTW